MRKMPYNPFQDKINALNVKDIEETLKTQSYLKQSHEPIQDDINNARYTMTDILPVNVLKPEDLSMKDLLDQIQIQTILNNNTPPFIEKKIKSDTTEAMIKDFQNEIAKPVEINGTFYKFRPPGVAINLKDLPPEFPNEATYKANINALVQQEFRKQDEIGRRSVQIQDIFRGLNQNLDNGSLSISEYHKAQQYYAPIDQQLRDAVKESEMKVSTLEQEWKDYSKNKIEYDAQREKISKENQQSLTAYEDEIKSRNTGMEVGKRDNETEEEYAQRLIDIAHETVDPASVELQAKSFAYNAVKDRLNEVLPAYKSEAVINAIIDEGGYEKLQPIKDQWPMLKKKLEETFGDVRRVENTDSIAQVLYVSSLKPAVRQGPVNAVPIPTVPTPNVTRASTALVSSKALPSVSTLPVRYNPPTANLIDTSFPPPALTTSTKDKIARMRAEQANREEAALQEARGALTSYYATKEQERKKQIDSNLKTNILVNRAFRTEQEKRKEARRRGEAITAIDFALEPTDRFYPTEAALRSYPTITERLNQLLAPPSFTPKTSKRTPIKSITRIGVEDLRPTPGPITPRSKSVEQKNAESGRKSGRPQSQMGPAELIRILVLNGLPASKDKGENYRTVLEAGLLPPRITLIPREDFMRLSSSQKAQYLEENQMVGPSGGVPVNKITGQIKPDKTLNDYFDRYLNLPTSPKTGKGLTDDLKSRFDIIDGEINAGNNNPALIRDARKLLKEMVTKKMVTLYEAQSHLKYLRSLNKI